MAEDWIADVRRYVPAADEKVVGKIARYLGIALRNRDSSLVSFTDPEEVGRVRERFLRNKLALTSTDDVLNEGLDWVKGLMTGDRTKNRVTVYYLLAHYFGKLDLFGGAAGTSAASLGGAVTGPEAANIAEVGETVPTPSASAATSAPSASESEPIRFPKPATVSDASSANQSNSAASGSSEPQAAFGGRSESNTSSSSRPAQIADLNDDGRSGWPRWLIWLLVALAVIALLFLLKSCMAERTPATADTASSETGMAPDGNLAADANAIAPAATGAASTVPIGAGVVSAVIDNKPTLTVYFESGKSGVSNDFAAAAGVLKNYLDSNPGAKLAVSGYNDPSGNAALNAELSKKRAQAVAAALAAAGIPEGSIELVKPADTATASVTAEQARRVEVTVK